MTDTEFAIATHIVSTMALAVLQGDDAALVRREMLAQYGEYGYDLAERFCKETIAEAAKTMPSLGGIHKSPQRSEEDVRKDNEAARIMGMSNIELAT